jgi:hypothetical protein
MVTGQSSFAASHDSARTEAAGFAALSAGRLLVIGGIALIVMGMIFGDVFAVFVLHPNANRIGRALLASCQAVAAGDAAAVGRNFAAIGDALENRGTKVDAHLHMVDFGYLALLLAIVMPYVALSEPAKKRLAALLVSGAVVLPVGVFAIHYVGLAYSPLESIGWASIIADAGGLFVILACAGFLIGLWRHWRGSAAAAVSNPLLTDRSWSCRVLLAGGTLLILAGFLHGAWYAARDLYKQEELDVNLLSKMTTSIRESSSAPAGLKIAEGAVGDYGGLQADHAVKIAAHAHIIEFGFVAMLAAFFQPYVFLSERWKRRWAVLLLLGGVTLPVFVLLELRYGLLAGGFADFGGFLVILALAAMLTGVLRYTGSLDAAAESARPQGTAS